MYKHIFKFGVSGGLVSSILGTLNWIFIAESSGVKWSQAVGYVSIALSLLCIPFGVRYFRDKLNDGMVSFSQAFKIGLGITGIAGIVMAIHSMLFFALQKDEFLAWQRKSLSETELVAFNEQLAQMPDFVYSPWFQGIVMFVMVLLIGIIVNFISSFLLKREAKQVLN